MVIALLVPFLAVIIGVAKIDDCPVNSMIPVYLVSAVSGHCNGDKAKWSYDISNSIVHYLSLLFH